MKRIQLWYNKRAPSEQEMLPFECADAVLVAHPTTLAPWVSRLRERGIKILPYISFYKSPRLAEIPELTDWEAGSPGPTECKASPFWQAVASDDHPEWLARDEAGKIRRPFESDEYARGWNETSPLVASYREACLTGVRNVLAAGYDGVFLDNVLINYRPDHAGLGAGKDVAEAMKSLVIEAGNLTHQLGGIFMINGDIDEQMKPVIDLYTLESFVFSWAWDYSMFHSDEWKTLWNGYRSSAWVDSEGPQPTAMGYLGFSGRSQREDAYALQASAWILGMAVCDGGTAANPTSIAEFAKKNLFQGATESALLYQARPVEDAWLREFYAVDIGDPSGGIMEQDGCLIRHFENGLCLFNPTDKAASVKLKYEEQRAHELACGVDIGVKDGHILVHVPPFSGRIVVNADDMRDVCCDNALRLLGMKEESGTLTRDTYAHAKERIPGGVQLLSKRPEMHAPGQWPAYFREAKGCEVWDLDGRHYYDMSIHGIGACLLGFRDPDVTKAVQRCVALGSMSTLSPPEEVELADLLCDIHPWAEQVRFARCGGEIGSVATRIARATTDRSLIAICGYHGWHDWYLAANLGESDALRGHLLPGLEPLGVPRELRGTTLPFRYNSKEEFQAILDAHGDQLAAVIMEPCRLHDPEPGFLEYVRDGAHKAGALLIFDEITIGWRTCLGGSHLRLGVNPDMAIFAKSLGNGHPIAAVIGTRESMAGAHSSFISSTYWTESVGPVAGVATVRKHMAIDVPSYADRIGRMVSDSWGRHASAHKLPVVLGDGYPCFTNFSFDHELSKELKTLYAQQMLKRGFLAALSFYATMAHTEEIIALYDVAIDEVFGEIAESLAKGDEVQRLEGPIAHSTFQRLI